MTIDEFIEALKKTPREWFLNGDGIRCFFERRFTCPVCRVAGNAGCAVGESGTDLDLSMKAIIELVDTADFELRKNEDLRKRMLEACGLNTT